MFTANEGKLHMLIVLFIPSFPRKRESRGFYDGGGFPLSRE